MTKIRITQVKSGIDRPERQKKTLKALGLNKMNASREVEATAQILGMVRTVNHLLKIEETDGGSTPEAATTHTNETKAATPAVTTQAGVTEPVTTQAQPEAPATEAPATDE